MKIYPAIDLYGGKAVRLYKGDYKQMTVYSDDPVSVALDFKKSGAEYIHLVDLEGAKNGDTPNFDTVCKIKEESGLFCEIGGGIRDMSTVEKYFAKGVDRVILGTAAIKDPEFLEAAVAKYGEKIAVGVDVKDGCVAIKGWVETSDVKLDDFCSRLQSLGVKTLIVTDISKDGAMQGANLELYQKLSQKYSTDFIASGGVSDLESVRRLAKMNIHGAIIGKAYYTGAVKISDAIREAK